MKLSELLDKPEKWTKGAFARNAKGFSVGSNNPSAECWCLVGAVVKSGVGYEPLASAARELYPDRGHKESGLISFFNDHPDTTFDDVRKVILRAEEMEAEA